MALNFTFTQNNFIYPVVGLTPIDDYYKFSLKKDSKDENFEAILKTLNQARFLKPKYELLVENGLEKTFNIAKFGLNVFSAEIPKLKEDLENLQELEMKQWDSISSLCSQAIKVSIIANIVFYVLGLVWIASLVLPISSPLSSVSIVVVLIASNVTCIFAPIISTNHRYNKAIEQASKNYPNVFPAIDDFDHDAPVAKSVLSCLSNFIDQHNLKDKIELNSKIKKIYDELLLQFELRKSIRYLYCSKQ